MNKKLLFGIYLVVIAISVVSAVSSFPYTRFSHGHDWCMYYTGDAMCWVPHEYCNNDGSVRELTRKIGECPTPVNVAPKVSFSSSRITVEETDTVVIDARCLDDNGDDTTITFSGWMNSNTKKTDYDDAGEYRVKVTCEDPSGEKDSESIKVTVLNKNRPPVFIY